MRKKILNIWDNKNTDIDISFVCITYNQEKTIADTIDGMLKQKTSYNCEIIIHDDNSSDGTVDILKSYRLKYPKIINLILQKENQFSISPSKPLFNCFNCAKGRYVAICEGDDYWTDQNKIERQVEFLDESNLDLSVHDAKCIQFDGQESNYQFSRELKRTGVLDLSSIARNDLQFSPTASMVIRKRSIDMIPKNFRNLPCLDVFLEIFCGLKGIYSISDKMSVYRLNVPGSYSEKNAKNRKNQVQFMENVISSFEMLREYLTREDYNKVKPKLLYYYSTMAFNMALSNEYKRRVILSTFMKSVSGFRLLKKKDLMTLFYLLGIKYECLNKILYVKRFF